LHDPNLDSTSITLLGRLRDQPADPKAWEDFVVRYRRPIYAFCLARSLQPADAEDVTQQVLARLRLKLRDFRYDPKRKFRAWLRTVSRHILSDFLAAQPRDGAIGDSKIGDMLERVEAREELAGQLEAEFDRELLDEAVRRVRVRVPDRHWDAFRLTMIEGLSGAEAAARLDMLVATVYTAKSKVKKLVREEIGRIEVEMDLVR
jgi:RNA polymerase sigma-70 factor (ECF subfamily)